jgi:CRP/FNR family cyclic AMP-dependent transcriptional regulator
MFSTQSLVLQLSYLFLVLAVVFTRGQPRLFIALSALVVLIHAVTFTGDPATIGWMALLLGCCLVVLGRDLLAQHAARFNAEEEAMLASFLAGVPRAAARHFIDGGVWLHGTVGDELTCEGEQVQRVAWLASGEALVMSDGRQVATCRKGDLIGEASVLTGDVASATVILAGPARFWCMPADTLREYLQADPVLGAMLERSFARAVRTKLHASNRTIAAAGGVA